MYCLGTILSMQISFVGFQPVQSSEHMAVWSMGCWGMEYGYWEYVVLCVGVPIMEYGVLELHISRLATMLISGRCLMSAYSSVAMVCTSVA